MKRIIIFGDNSWIGNAFASFADTNYLINKISSRVEIYKAADFSQTDCILYCAGIAHQKAEAALHFSVNCDLALSVAEKAKEAGVGQFIYLSSASVFGKASGAITPTTPLNPNTPYGQSKLKAETELKKLEDVNFVITIVRPPMVYGQGCKGNFERLVKLVKISPVFPDISNRRSMIYIDNLCYFLSEIIERRLSGTFFPQNSEPVCTADLVRQIAHVMGKKVRFTLLFNWLIPLLLWVPTVSKLFSDFVYESMDIELVKLINFKKSIEKLKF